MSEDDVRGPLGSPAAVPMTGPAAAASRIEISFGPVTMEDVRTPCGELVGWDQTNSDDISVLAMQLCDVEMLVSAQGDVCHPPLREFASDGTGVAGERVEGRYTVDDDEERERADVREVCEKQ